jgi:hypothetical protein
MQRRGGGGGGRIAVVLTNATDFGSVKMQACGGAAGTVPANGGAAGTLYLQTSAQGPGHGKPIMDNNNVVVRSNSTVILASTNPATLTGNNAFHNFTCTGVGKTVR